MEINELARCSRATSWRGQNACRPRDAFGDSASKRVKIYTSSSHRFMALCMTSIQRSARLCAGRRLCLIKRSN